MILFGTPWPGRKFVGRPIREGSNWNLEAFEPSSLMGHPARVSALHDKDGFLCTGPDDLSAKLWDVSTGQCIYDIQTHSCAAVKCDEQKLGTGSFDNTVACWEWSSGSQDPALPGSPRGFDYKGELGILVSGSEGFTVKRWALSAGTEHTEWITKVILQEREARSLLHSPGDCVL